MKPFRRSLLLAFALSTVACNAGPEPTGEEPGALQPQTQEAGMIITNQLPYISNTVPPSNIPVPPGTAVASPTPLTSIPYGTPLYPLGAGVRSAHTVILPDPGNVSGGFLAIGYDVRGYRRQFFVSGSNSRELRRLLLQISADIDALEQDSNTGTDFSWGLSGQVGGPIIPQPGIFEGAWRTAWNNNYQIASNQQ